jgi:recombinational DNA repair protein RecT
MAQETTQDFVIETSDSYKRIEERFIGIYGQAEGKRRWQQECTFVKQAFATNPKLLECTHQSMGMALSKLAAQEATIDPSLQFYYLVPRPKKVGENNWINEVALQGGMYNKVEKINEAGLQVLNFDIIYEGEKYQITNGKLVSHEVDLALRNKEPRPNILVGYMATQLPNGGEIVYDFAYPKDLKYSQSFSKTKNNPLYDPNQSLETALQRICYNKRFKTIGKAPIKAIRQPDNQDQTPKNTSVQEDLTNIFDKPNE